MRHPRPKMRNTARFRLLRPTQIRLRNQDVAHAQHPKAAQLLRRVENDRRKSRRHFRIQSDFDAGLDFVFAFHQHVQNFLRIDDRLPEIRHQADQMGVPFVDDLRERRRSGRQQNLSATIQKFLQRIVANFQETLRSPFFRYLKNFH